MKYCELQLDIEKLFDGIFILTNEKKTLEGVNEDIGSKEGISNKVKVTNEEINTNLEDVVTFFKKIYVHPKI